MAKVIQTTTLQGTSGKLELLHCAPNVSDPVQHGKAPILFVHGSYGSAHCYQFLLLYLASCGHATYAISIRGHGNSHPQSFFTKMFLTSIDNWAADIVVALSHMAQLHPNVVPVLAGHSLGGGIVQYMVSTGIVGSASGAKANVAGLILLGAAPLKGSGQIMTNLQLVEAPNGYAYPWSDRNVLHTPDQARALYFSPEAEEGVVARWMSECRTPVESARAGFSIFGTFGEPGKILNALDGVQTGDGSQKRTRKVLHLAAGQDRLVTPEMVLANAAAYAEGSANEDESLVKTIDGSGHHLMMDAYHEGTAKTIADWLGGGNL
jgi:pimeloyl-ACP methyl ester carboxylesterase